MRILIISNMYPSKQKPYSGLFVKNQYEYLKNVLKADIDIFYMKRIFTNKIGSFFKYSFFYFRFIPLLLKKVDVIHVHFFSIHFILGLIYKSLYKNTKIIVTLHGSDIKIYKKLKIFQNSIDHLIAVSRYQNDLLKQSGNRVADSILCAGIRKDIFYQLTNISKVYDFIFVGSFYKVKGIDLLIEAIKKIEYNLKICFIGSGPYMNDIKKLQRNSTSHIDIFYDLTQKEIMKFYNKSKFLVLPSRNDSFGLVVTEALYCGTPVIVSNMSGTKEQVADNYNGFLIRNNITELRDTMCNVLKLSPEEYNRLSANASKSNQQYSLENVTKELLKIYQR